MQVSTTRSTSFFHLELLLIFGTTCASFNSAFIFPKNLLCIFNAFMSTLLATRGPLANVWLASNYDKKLSKLQFLNTDIIGTSQIVSDRQLSASSFDAGENTITLRLSGQLLLGIVRIYLRQTKYLLDDVHETLYKLKNSFRQASGASLGSSSTSSVNLPPKKTLLSNPARIQLQEQAGNLDLFYQDELVFDDIQDTTLDVLGASDFDLLIETGRNVDAAEAVIDFDLDLDFDLDAEGPADNSIEQGRNGQLALQDPDASVFDLSAKQPDTSSIAIDLSGPLELRPDVTETEPLTPTSAGIPNRTSIVGFTPAPFAERARVGIDSGVIRTTKRKIVIDSSSDLQRGIPNSVFREIQNLQLDRRFITDLLSVQRTLQERLDLIEELAKPMLHKRRKLGSIDNHFRRRCLDLSLEERVLPDTAASDSILDLDPDINFDLSLPDLESDNTASPEPEKNKQMANKVETLSGESIENLRSTAQVAGHLREIFYEISRVSFDTLVEKDTHATTGVPLGATCLFDPVKVSERREATKCFFELLVLASQDCITLEQPLPRDDISLPEDLHVRPRDGLLSKFL